MTQSKRKRSNPEFAAVIGLPVGLLVALSGLLGLPGGIVGVFFGLGYVLLSILLFPATVGVMRLQSWGRLIGTVAFCGMAVLHLTLVAFWGIPGIWDLVFSATLFGCGLYLLFCPDFESSSSRDVDRLHHPNR